MDKILKSGGCGTGCGKRNPIEARGRFEIETGKELADFATVGAERAAHIGKQVWSLTFSPNSQLLTTGGEYATQLWDVRQAKEVHRISSRPMRKPIAFFSPDGGKMFF